MQLASSTLTLWLNGLAVSALGIWAQWPRSESWVAPLYSTLGKLFTHTASPVSHSKKLGHKSEFSVPKCLCWLSVLD